MAEGADRSKQIDFLEFEIDEIEAAGLRVGEDEELEAEYARMSHGQKIAEALAQARQLTGYESGIGDLVGRAVRGIGQVTEYDKALEGLYQELLQIEDLIGDFDRSISGYMDDFSYDEQEFYRISQRLDQINRLKSKYGSTVEEIFEYQRQKTGKTKSADGL